jgi:hypothetical protein
LLIHGLSFKQSIKIGLAADTISITTMEIVDTIIVLSVPGALNAGPATSLFWASLIASLIVAFAAAVPVNRYLIARGKGHAVVHQFHQHH